MKRLRVLATSAIGTPAQNSLPSSELAVSSSLELVAPSDPSSSSLSPALMCPAGCWRKAAAAGAKRLAVGFALVRCLPRLLLAEVVEDRVVVVLFLDSQTFEDNAARPGPCTCSASGSMLPLSRIRYLLQRSWTPSQACRLLPYFIRSMPKSGQRFNGKYTGSTMKNTVRFCQGTVKVQPSQGCVTRYLGMHRIEYGTLALRVLPCLAALCLDMSMSTGQQRVPAADNCYQKRRTEHALHTRIIKYVGCR